MKLLQLNLRSFGAKMNEKINILKEAIMKLEIDAIIMSVPDKKWSVSKRGNCK